MFTALLNTMQCGPDRLPQQSVAGYWGLAFLNALGDDLSCAFEMGHKAIFYLIAQHPIDLS